MFKSIFHNLLMSLCFLTLISCDSSPKKKEVTTAFDIQAAAMEFNMACSTTNCNPSMAAVFTLVSQSDSSDGIFNYSYINYQLCTSWKVGSFENKTLMITNRHCIENVVSEDKENCGSKITFRFLENTSQGLIPVSANCSRIMETSQISTKLNTSSMKLIKDYSIILLDRDVDRPSIEIKQEKAIDGLEVTIESIDFDGPNKTTKFKSQTCKYVVDTVYNRFSFDDEGPILMTHGCHLVEGNSGSVVFNSERKAIGLAFGSDKKEDKDTNIFSLLPSLEDKKVSKKPRNFSFALNFACMDSPLLGLKASPNCTAVIDESYLSSFEAAKKLAITDATIKVSKAMESAVSEWIMNHSNTFMWKFDEGSRMDDKGDTIFKLIPRCIVKPEDRKENWFHSEKNKYPDGWVDDSASFVFSLPVVDIKITISLAGQSIIEKTLGNEDIELLLDLNQIIDRPQSISHIERDAKEKGLLGILNSKDASESSHTLATENPNEPEPEITSSELNSLSNSNALKNSVVEGSSGEKTKAKLLEELPESIVISYASEDKTIELKYCDPNESSVALENRSVE